MTGYSTISIDKVTKNRASKRAKKDRMSVSVIARILLNDYADGKITIGSRIVVTENGFTPEFENEVLSAEKEPSTKMFESANDAIAFLHEEVKKAS